MGKVIHWELFKKSELDHTTNQIQNLSWKIRLTEFSGILKYKQITKCRLKD